MSENPLKDCFAPHAGFNADTARFVFRSAPRPAVLATSNSFFRETPDSAFICCRNQTCDVPGCGNEVHTYCTLANPIEEFTCPKCVEKKSLTKHLSLDARIAERRAAGDEFKY